jgi:hypothetical protein
MLDVHTKEGVHLADVSNTQSFPGFEVNNFAAVCLKIDHKLKPIQN